MPDPRPLSPAAQAVLDAVDKVCVTAFLLTRRDVAAAAIRALTDLAYEDCNGEKLLYVPEILAIAAELDGGATQPISTETPNG